MNSLKQLVVVTIFAALACTGLYAQSLDMRATIPFDFRAGNTLMPAGEYDIHSQGTWVILRLADGGRPVVGVMTNGATGGTSDREARLDFHRYGNAYFLTTIWSPFSRDGRQLPPTAREKELAQKGRVPVESAVVLASNK
ncbi:MAG TPA: hypothetical protein VN841_23160 [Bryobacteraceae bacterium]|nr:hypothetical protein [Bryobacteraceae bacterium]